MPHPHYTHFSKTPNNAPLLTGPPRGVKCPHLGALFSPSTTHGLRTTTKRHNKMSCCGARKPKTLSPTRSPPRPMPLPTTTNNYPQPKTAKHETVLSIPHCKVHLVDEGEAIDLATGDFKIIQLSDDDVLLATIIKINDDLQWPLTKDEPVVKLDRLHYLFSLKVVKDEHPLNYGVTFSDTGHGDFKLLDKFLKEHSCFSTSSSSSRKTDLDWKEFAPKIDAYNNVIAKAIAEGTGQIVKGIFICSNAYTNKSICQEREG
ncbi:hypothetical protein HanPI659440_Chr03g0094961 [Helianthus annuus]|nr:hypothetical protein HanPI659440_Chr03g0094961 [Helianthus annuus]